MGEDGGHLSVQLPNGLHAAHGASAGRCPGPAEPGVCFRKGMAVVQKMPFTLRLDPAGLGDLHDALARWLPAGTLAARSQSVH